MHDKNFKNLYLIYFQQISSESSGYFKCNIIPFLTDRLIDETNQ
jgi:hypothetical protein